ncbi:MAG: hypothetical protein Q4B30_01495 [Coriobacteriaceae bacterium]|nr:hypothetical protein [Coriobacteriaceae bacterium]
MAFDPIQEDGMYLVLRHLIDGGKDPSSFPDFDRAMHLYSIEPDLLIKDDSQRSFHLTARAAELLDYKIPFMVDADEASRAEEEVENLLREALALDPDNLDARRLNAIMQGASNDAYLNWLIDGTDEIEGMLRDSEPADEEDLCASLASDLIARPYVRWLNAIASQALICGQYRLALAYGLRSIKLDAEDPGDVYRTVILAMAKLEYPADEIAAYAEANRVRPIIIDQSGAPQPAPDIDPWKEIALLSAAYKRYDFEGAREPLSRLLDAYPHAAHILFFQTELPEGAFARVRVIPGTDDELMIAISEATPLLQEGLGAPESAAFAAWIANTDMVQRALENEPSPWNGTGAAPASGPEA